MKEEPLHPWIEPELEARITALVLGEASDFEREELERLIEDQAELAVFRKRMETVHSLLREVATGETAADDDDWKLSDERRAAVLAVIDGEGDEKKVENVVEKPASQPKARRGSIFKTITQIAAVLFVMAIIAGLMMPDYKKVTEKSQTLSSRTTATMDAINGDRVSRSNEATPSRSAPVASAAEVSKRDFVADSHSALASIQGNLDAYPKSSEAPIPSTATATASNVAVAGEKMEMPNNDRYLYADVGSGGAVRGVAGQSIDGTVKLDVRSDNFADSTGAEISLEQASPTAIRRNRKAGEPAQSNMALGKSGGDPFAEPAPAAAMDDEAGGVPVSSLVSAAGGFVGTQTASKMDRDAGGKNVMAGEDREEVSATRQLAEAQSSMARGQTAAADAPKRPMEAVSAGRGRVAGKKGKAQTPGLLAPAAPAGSRPAVAATPMSERTEMLREKGMKPPAVRKTEGEVDELSSKMLVDRKQVDGNQRSDFLSQVKDQSEMKASKLQVRGGQALGEALTEAKNEVHAGARITLAKPSKPLSSTGKEAAAKNAPKDPLEAKAKGKEEGFFLRGAKLNDVFSMLAKSGGLNYFHNPALEGSEYVVTGRLQEGGDPLSQMEELGLMYGVTFLQDGKTVQSLKAPEKKSAAPSGLDERKADEEAFSTFSLHVSDVSFKLAQAALAKGEWPEAAKVRIEEFVNAFDYGDPMPGQNEKVACRMEQAIHPFLQQRNLLRVSMRTAAAGRSGDTPLRLTFLLDNSGSMERIDRQETVRRAFALLAQQLKPIDQVTLITFARQPRLLADKVSGAKSAQLVQLVANIPSEGGTNLEAALQLAFEKAREQKIDTAQNRVIMLTDGAANLGDADPDSLAQLIETMRDAGIAFDAAGIGAEGLNDEILEALTRKGDGRYYLLDRPENADAGFARQIAGALRPAAKNVKVQVEFNPERVGNYKLLGFEKHLLKKEDFRNDKVDAAEMAAAEAGVAVYQFEAKPDGRGDVGSVSVRFRDMSSGQMVEKRWPIPYQADAPRLDEAAPSLRIAATAALLAAKLKGEALGQSVDLKTLSNFAAGLPDRYRNAQRIQQLQEMINQARAASR